MSPQSQSLKSQPVLLGGTWKTQHVGQLGRGLWNRTTCNGPKNDRSFWTRLHTYGVSPIQESWRNTKGANVGKKKPTKKQLDEITASFKQMFEEATSIPWIEHFKRNPNLDLDTFHGAWNWLVEHPVFNQDYACSFQSSLDIMVVKCHPKLHRICNNDKLNTATEVWLECGPGITEEEAGIPEAARVGRFVASHDLRLDCGGKTFEEAILKLSKLVLKYYGDYPE